MTREKAYKEIRNLIFEDSENVWIADAEAFIDEIYDSFESRTCESCRIYKQCPVQNVAWDSYMYEVGTKFYCSLWKAKESE